ncbi:GNAT family N-acetyltransferase [Micromonospora sp. FIMYZ51]|uniref:GNAT family N-acetyltransferase n=1 Tax=Micromonospora sp. FIMYZ51 TaxID=3051832 RepID=UPI00312047AE
MSPTLAVRVRLAAAADLDALGPACTAAFVDEAVLCWVLPDPAERAARTPAMFQAMLDVAVRDEQITVAELPDGTLAGVSAWIAPGATAAGADPAAQPAQVSPTDDPVARRLATVAETVAAHRPREPHLYLASMGVRPERRGHGLGGAMLSHRLREADAAGLPAYLEASTERSRRLYLRHGFHDHGRPLALPDGAPVLRPMWRPGANPARRDPIAPTARPQVRT